MSDQQKQLDELKRKLDILIEKQDLIGSGISMVKSEMEKLSTEISNSPESTAVESPQESVQLETSIAKKELLEEPEISAEPLPEPEIEIPSEEIVDSTPYLKKEAKPSDKEQSKTPDPENTWFKREAFMGSNLISKVGILIIIIGVSIGGKYAIENNLVSPTVRIINGYLIGFILMYFAYRLTHKMKNYSMVLLSGSFAIHYIVTYFAYSFYDMYPQWLTFLLMVAFTVFTTLSALYYDKKIIAHIGLVGAYAVPFLLSDGSGRVGILFTYMAIINVGVLFLIKYRYWKSVIFNAYGFTWLTFMAWKVSNFKAAEHLELALIFMTIFFLIFLVMFVYHFKENAFTNHVVLVFTNAFLYFGLGYEILHTEYNSSNINAAFTFMNSLIYLVPIFYLAKKKELKPEFFYVLIAISLIFFTMTISVLFNGKVVTSLWAIESVALFYIGRKKNFFVFERSAYALILLTTASMMNDWGATYRYSKSPDLSFLFNSTFFTSVIVMIAHYLIGTFNSKFASEKYGSIVGKIKYILAVTVYFSFFLEIFHYWQIMIESSRTVVDNHAYFNKNFVYYQPITLGLFSMTYLSLIFYFHKKTLIEFKNKIQLFTLSVGIAYTFLLFFLILNYTLFDVYIFDLNHQQFSNSFAYVLIRYVSYIILGLMIVTILKFAKSYEIKNHLMIVKIFAIISIYLIVIVDIHQYWQIVIENSRVPDLTTIYNPIDWYYQLLFKGLFTALYFALLFQFNKRTIEDIKDSVAIFNFALVSSYILLIFFLINHHGLYNIYLNEVRSDYFDHSLSSTMIHYVSFSLLGYLYYAINIFAQDRTLPVYRNQLYVFGNIAILSFLTTQMTFYLDVLDVQDTNKLYVTILWGLYALSLVSAGLFKKIEVLRKFGIALIFICVGKLFFYDIAHLSTIKKTIVFVVLGVIMLLISYLFNKYLEDDGENDDSETT